MTVCPNQAQNTLAKPGVNHCTKSSLQSSVSSQREVGKGGGLRIIWVIVEVCTKDKRGNLRTGLKECLGQGQRWDREQKRRGRVKKIKIKIKTGKLPQDAWLFSPSHPSRCGNVMETPECLQTLSAMATVWWCTQACPPPPPSLPALTHSLQILWISAEISCCTTLCLFWRPKGRNLQ